MDSISLAVGATAPIKIGDDTFTAAPVDLYDLGVVEAALRASIIQSAVDGTASAPEPVKDKALDRAMDKAGRVAFDSPEMQAFLKSPAGACVLIAVSLRKNHPDMVPSAVGAKFVGKLPDLQRVSEVIGFISGFGDKPGGGKAKVKGNGQAGTFRKPEGASDSLAARGALRLDTTAGGAAHTSADRDLPVR